MTGMRLRRHGRGDLAGMAAVINARIAAEGEGEHTTVASLAEVYNNLTRCDPARRHRRRRGRLGKGSPTGSFRLYESLGYREAIRYAVMQRPL
jgi:hypothetical protein